MKSRKIGAKMNFVLLAFAVILISYGNYAYVIPEVSNIDSGDTAWMIVATALVLLMTPGLAFFYGGMVNIKSIISTMLQSYVALGVISVLWVWFGFSLSFGESLYGIIGNPFTHMNFKEVTLAPNNNYGPTIPFLIFALFQLKFAIITPALISGSFAERIRFRSYILFMLLFTIFIYSPLAHMTWHVDGLFRNLGVIDFAGGTVVHMSAGLAALAGAIYLGSRKKVETKPANIPFVLLGTGLLWFGWFGFNAGSALGANEEAIIAFANTSLASATGMISWIFFDRFRNKKMSAIGASIGAIVGLVAITPAAGVVTLGQSVLIGFIAALCSNVAISLFHKTRIDDTLDVFPSHGIGGIVGMILTGVFAKEDGLIYGEYYTFMIHLLAVLVVSAYTLVVTYGILYLVDKITPIRVREDQEEKGLDASQHGEYF